jgi:flagellar FliL protein
MPNGRGPPKCVDVVGPPGKSCRAAQRLVNHERHIVPTGNRGMHAKMSTKVDSIEAAEIAAIEAGLPHRWWSGKRIVFACAVLAALAVGFYALSQFQRRAAEVPAAASPHYVDVPDLMVNLRTADGERRYLKVKVMLEAASDKDAAAITERLPAVIDGFQSFLRELRPEDLSGAAGSYRVKEEMLVRVNRAAAPAQARDVLVQELIQQ